MEFYWNRMKDKQRIVVKVGSSTLTNKDTGNLNYEKLEELVKALSDLKNKGKDVILVSSGAVAVGREILKIGIRPKTMAEKQACAAIGQCALMGSYHNLFAKYNMIVSQVLMTKYSIDEEKSYNNIKATFDELLKYNAIPIVNENDTVKSQKTSEVIRKICNVIFNFFDEVLGEGTSKKIFESKTSLTLCTKAYEDFINAKKKQDEAFENLSKKYSSNRVTRRAKK